MRVLLTAERNIPMPAVDLRTVRRSCVAAVCQTLLRDIAALGVLTAAIVLQPLGTLGAVAGTARCGRLRSRSALARLHNHDQIRRGYCLAADQPVHRSA